MKRQILKTMRLGIKENSKVVTAVVITLLLSASVSTAFASIPDNNGLIHACYSTNKFSIIDSATQSCKSNETALTWNQQGPKGDTGPQGPSGSSGGSDYVSNLVGADLSNADLRYRNFIGKDFSNANLSGTNTRGADFSNANFSGAILLNANGGGKFVGANFSNTTFNGVGGGADLTNVNLSVLNNINNLFLFSGSGSNFTNTNFSGGVFDQAHFEADPVNGVNTVLNNTNFTGGVFKQTYFTGADLSTANLTGVTWVSTVCPDATSSDWHGNTCIGHLVP